MKITIVLPIYNESKVIGSMLNQLDSLQGDWEIIFSDGGCTDDTIQKIPARYRVLKSPKGRANQMNHGAAHATSDVLWFVHCDSKIPSDAHAQITQAIALGNQWGCFHIGFDYDGPFMSCNTYFSNRRARNGIAFGDQGIWITKELFDSMGGFPDLPIMEDYEFSLRMKEAKISICQLPGTIVTSGRRYENQFPPITMWQMFYLRCLYRKGVDIQEIARRYRDIR